MNLKDYVVETVLWQAKQGVSTEDMSAAIDDMLVDLKTLQGFLHETLCQASNGDWMQLYYWETEHDAQQSSALMADKASFVQLLSLIAPESVEINVYTPVQVSSEIAFT
ncbi:hypothetical protein [Enterovibrio norvegicus]|uniref:hypothetical protein n=1 Tax=Enterovibrio norvegicus TaxID=188144 RepID=UPI000C852AA2|nr:hypothetical protein [Enterovibrio norvegicus]PML77408.1 hypothetical protein BCT69_20475 [Enterovibrio norvegicus]